MVRRCFAGLAGAGAGASSSSGVGDGAALLRRLGRRGRGRLVVVGTVGDGAPLLRRLGPDWCRERVERRRVVGGAPARRPTRAWPTVSWPRTASSAGAPAPTRSPTPPPARGPGPRASPARARARAQLRRDRGRHGARLDRGDAIPPRPLADACRVALRENRGHAVRQRLGRRREALAREGRAFTHGLL